MTELTYADDQIGWYAILTLPQREKRMIDELARFGVYSFYPVQKKWRTRRSARKVPNSKRLPDGRAGYFEERKILPGYIFSKFVGLPRWHVIRALPYISGVLGHMGKPICLKYGDLKILHELRHRQDEMDRHREVGWQIAFQPGDEIVVTEHGALEGFVSEITAIDATKEVAYLRDLTILGREMPVPYAHLAHTTVAA